MALIAEIRLPVFLFAFLATFSQAQAVDITIINGQTETTTQSATADGDTITIENGGRVDTTGTSNFGISNFGFADVTVNNNGEIETDDADGIRIDGDSADNNTVTNNGTITTNASNGRGIRIFNGSDNATITNNGSIITNGTNSEGIANSLGDTVTIINNGSISTNGTSAEGVISSGANNVIENNGSIVSNGSDAEGIEVFGVNTIITNTGDIDADGDGIRTDTDNTSITNDGSIVSGLDGIEVNGENSTITNNGTITTTANGEGIEANGNTNTILNTGTINSNGTEAQGIQVSNGSNLTVTNTGTITANGSGADGIRGTNINNSQLTNNGVITTTNGGEGLETSGSFNVLLNTGTITTNGSGAFGFWDNGTNNTLTNDGTIITNGSTGYGLGTYGDFSVLTNNGVIQTIGTSAVGIGADDNATNALLINNGTIETNGLRAHGIFADSTTSNIEIINNGSITTNSPNVNPGDSAHGIYDLTNDGIITNTGTIQTTGYNSEGIFLNGDGTTVTNSGSIFASGLAGDGIASVGNMNVVITNTGNIEATGEEGSGIWMNSTGNNIINNSGLISATGPGASRAIYSEGAGNDTLNLLPGWQIVGPINLGGGTNIINISGGTGSSVFDVAGIGGTTSVNFLNGTGLIVGSSVITVDPTGQSVQGEVLSTLTSNIHNIFGRRSLQSQPLGPVQVAALELTPGMLVQERAPVSWAQVFGGRLTRDTDELVLAHEYEYVGITAGYEQDYRKGRIGFSGGFAHGNVETDMVSIDTETNSIFGGVYGLLHLGWANLTGSLIGGYEWHDNDRYISTMSGFETAEADFDSFFVSPSLTLSAAYQSTERTEIRPSATVTYVAGFYDDYTESGTTSSNLAVDSRTVQAVTTRVQLAAAYQLSEIDEIEFRAGFKSRHTDDEEIDLNLAGANFTVPAAGDESVYGGFVGMNLRIAVQDRWHVSADVELSHLSGDENDANGNINVEYSW
jgi:hypothetical protein